MKQQKISFEKYLANNFRKSTMPDYYLYADNHYPLLHIDRIKELYNLLDAAPTPTPETELLKTIYHEIDIKCISETNHVTMDSVRSVLVKHGAIEADLW